jgi:hypothetical protein
MILAPVLILGIVGLALLLRPWPFFLTAEESHPYHDRNVAVEFVKWVERQALARGGQGRRLGSRPQRVRPPIRSDGRPPRIADDRSRSALGRGDGGRDVGQDGLRDR